MQLSTVTSYSTILASSQPTSPPAAQKDRPLILYAYSQTDSARDNLKFFIAHGLHAAADFVFIINGETADTSLIPKADNIRFIQRKNECYDLGAHAEVLLKDNLYKKYKKFIMMNASIRGPFVPYWAEACWSERYLNKLTDEVKLVGMTGNCWPMFHIQSMIWATDSVGLNTLLFPTPELAANIANTPVPNFVSDKLFPGINACFDGWNSAVSAEVGSSALIKAAGYKLDVMMSAFHSSTKYEEECDSSKNGDVLMNHAYFGTNVHPFETIFLKSNRDIDPVNLARMTEWEEGSKYSSFDHCSL
ncbi:hypothetical protein BJ878DRAFT_415554 [Calycina marina]|uniref:Uncharacterized protein n=1 Tax=Calycina marina TaxID=1763456 RepID=A0A9P8CJ46_9HELO|nr:hypothetical protein BJ878DRAFT_415554 [Calycina marina]